LNISDYFDGVYRSSDRYWWQEKDRYALDPDAYPHSLSAQMTLRILAGQSGLRVLDLGAGEGADAIRLALLGHQVDAVEISGVAAKKIRRYAAEAQVALNVLVCDISQYKPAITYDVIICNGVLQYIEDKPPVLQMIQEATAPGGLNVISLWSTASDVPEFHNKVPTFCDEEDGVVVNSYKPWTTEFIYFERHKLEKSHHDLPEHVHSHIKLIARKPDNTADGDGTAGRR
jgi:2-polyprenyl-3-methyl-5-hydroxy-6-metoxy-1,4-benzoquinol methylase